MARYYPGHPKWKYKMGRKAWLKLKKQRKRCKELFIAGNHYAHFRAERCKSLDELKKVVLRDLTKKNNPMLRDYEQPLKAEEVETVAADLAESAWAWQQKKISEGKEEKCLLR